mmetsp:Transcript_38257/g.70191  ORF Transcript_38257/g.70191 Transcript_38257/m.70191 type:complete len:99 (+) Transcript_38257:291-587(+)
MCTKQNYNTTAVPSWTAAAKTVLSKYFARRILEQLSGSPLYLHELKNSNMQFRWQSSSHGIDLEGVGRNIHSYPMLGEAAMGCGLQYINSKWTTLSDE